MVLAVWGSIFLISSGSMTMYSSLRNSYPLTISLRSTTTFSAGQMYCCFTRCLSGRCSMLNEMPLLRAPEKRRTGMEMSPKVKCPDQTDDGIVFSSQPSPQAATAVSVRDGVSKLNSTQSLAQNTRWMHKNGRGANRFSKPEEMGSPHDGH